MSTETVTAYMYRCDRCNNQFEQGDFTVFLDDPDFEAWDWVVTEEGQMYCHICANKIESLSLALAGSAIMRGKLFSCA